MLNISDVLAEQGILIDAETEGRFEKYFNMVVDYNEHVNLTAITDRDEFIIKHFADSVAAAPYIKLGAHVADIGSGAGFPAIPLKLVRNDLSFTLVDALNKRVDFLKSVVSELALSGITCLHNRAEEIGRSASRATFDVVVARAVADIRTLLEYCIPLLKVGGIFIAYKGGECDELKFAENALKLLHCKVKETAKFRLPVSGDGRTLIIIEKLAETSNKYPRGGGKEKSKPL